MGKLENKVAIVTGGGGGIGAATAKLLAEEGAQVLIVGRTESKLKATVETLNNPNISYFVADVSKSADTQAYIQEAVTRYGGLDILVSNAGVVPQLLPIYDLDESVFDEVMLINTKGVWLSVKYALQEMKKYPDKGGAIVLTGSIVTSAGFPAHSPYTASKHAVVGIMRSAFMDSAPFNIRINVVNPGPTLNEMMEATERSINAENPAAVRAMLEQRIPAKRYASNEDLANAILFLVSPQSSYITGVALDVDGGLINSLM